MSSLFRRASQVKKKFKICAYGPTGTGKTIFALTFPKLRYIDMESGTDWYIGRKIIPEQNDDFELLATKSAKKVIAAVNEIERDLEKDPECVETVVLDPVSVFWDALQEAFLQRLKKKTKNEEAEIKFQHWKAIKNPYKTLMTTLINLPVNLILVGREASEYEMKKGELIQVGTKIATEKDTPYIADIYLRFFTESTKEGEKFMARIEKDRTNLMKRGSVIENLTYQKLREMADKAGILNVGGDERKLEKDKDVVDQDTGVFDEEKKSHDELVSHPKIVPMCKELDWAPGKVKALIEKHEFKTVAELGKFLADEVRKKRSKEDGDEG